MHRLCFNIDFKWPRRSKKKEEEKTSRNPHDKTGPSQDQEAPIANSSCLMPAHENNSIDVSFKASRLLSTTTEKSKFFESTHEILRELSEAGLLPKDKATSSGGACWELVGAEPAKKIPPRLAAINVENEREKLTIEKLNAKQRRAEKRRLAKQEKMKEELATKTRIKVSLPFCGYNCKWSFNMFTMFLDSRLFCFL